MINSNILKKSFNILLKNTKKRQQLILIRSLQSKTVALYGKMSISTIKTTE